MRELKKTLVEALVDQAVSRKYKGAEADRARAAWRKELNTKSYAELQKDCDIVKERDFDFNIGGLN